MKKLASWSIVALVLSTTAAGSTAKASADRLTFLTEPSPDTPTNVPFTTAPRVAIVDELGNVEATNSSCVVSLKLGGGNAGDILLGTLSTTVAGGVADFSGHDLRVNTIGGGRAYHLVAAAEGGCSSLKSADSAAFAVNLNSLPHRLALAQAPGSASLNQVWDEQPVVVVLDDAGNLVSNDNSTVITLQKVGGPGGQIEGATSIRAVNGVATFAGLATVGSSANDAGTYRLRFTGTEPGISIGDVAAKQLISAHGLTPAKLAFQVFPQNVAINQPQRAIFVRTEDANQFFCPGDNATQVRLKFVAGPRGAMMFQNGRRLGPVGSTTEASSAVSGLTSFEGISFDHSGVYTLEAVARGLASSEPSRFAVTAFSVKDHLHFFRSPVGSGANLSPWKTQPMVETDDAYGNRVADDNSTVVTLSCVLPISGCSLLGNISVTTVNGVADFSGTDVRSNQPAGTPLVIEAIAEAGFRNAGPFMSGNFAQ